MEGQSVYPDAVRDELRRSGLGEAELVSSEPEDEASFGDTSVVFRVGPLLLRFTRDRGQQFVDIASESSPTDFYQFCDVEIAMGWRSVEDVLAEGSPETIESVLRCVEANLRVLMKAFSKDGEQTTGSRIQEAARRRGEAQTAELRRD